MEKAASFQLVHSIRTFFTWLQNADRFTLEITLTSQPSDVQTLDNSLQCLWRT